MVSSIQEGTHKLETTEGGGESGSVLRSSLLDCKFNWNWTGLD